MSILLKQVKMLMKSKAPLKDVLSYIKGNLLYQIYYSKLNFLIPSHIQEQFRYRLKKMRPECHWEGECQICHCQTPALQFASKSCEGNCYPMMMNSIEWNYYKPMKNITDEYVSKGN